jgi:integral membrane protein
MRKTTIGKFRTMGLIEGASLLILLFIAMPLKYWAGIPEPVRIVGSLHGLFFILYVLMILYTTYKVRWSFIWVVSAFVVAFIPFGNIILDRFLQRTFSVKEV